MRAFMILATLPLMLSPLLASETDLRLEHGIAATLTMPDGAGPFPAVLMMHGLGSSRDEVGNLLLDAADALSEEGIASLRFDFRGFGKSMGDTGNFTLDHQLADAQIALAALRDTKSVDASRIGVLGFSFGGGAAIELAGAQPDAVASVVVWTPVGNYEQDMRDSMGSMVFDRAKTDGIAGIDFGWRTLALKKGFFDSLLTHDLHASLQAYDGPFLTVYGEVDPYRKYADAMLDAAAGADKQAVIIDGSDHIFNVYKLAESKVTDLIDLTLDRFVATLAP